MIFRIRKCLQQLMRKSSMGFFHGKEGAAADGRCNRIVTEIFFVSVFVSNSQWLSGKIPEYPDKYDSYQSQEQF